MGREVFGQEGHGAVLRRSVPADRCRRRRAALLLTEVEDVNRTVIAGGAQHAVVLVKSDTEKDWRSELSLKKGQSKNNLFRGNRKGMSFLQEIFRCVRFVQLRK